MTEDNIKSKDEGFVTTKKAADLLGVAVSTIQLWTDDGLLSAWVTKGGHRRITMDSVNDLLLKQNLSKELSKSTSSANTPLSILIVEDDLVQINLYKQQIISRELDVNIIEASNGYEGLIMAGQYQPSIIITDLMMSDMDGFNMLKTICKTQELKDCLIIVVTALSLEEAKSRGEIPDCVSFYSKPIDFDKLENKILKKMLKR